MPRTSRRVCRPARGSPLVSEGGTVVIFRDAPIAAFIGTSTRLPRDRGAARENAPRDYIRNQHHAQEHQSGGPSLPVPVVIGGNSVGIDHHRKRGDGLVPPRTPESVI